MVAAPFVARFAIPGRIDAIRPAAAQLVGLVRGLEVQAAEATLFENAVVEVLNNAVEHTAGGREGAVHCEVELTPERLFVRVLHEAAAAPVALTAASERPPFTSWGDLPESGYGLSLMRAVFSDVRPIARDGRYGVEMSLER